MWIGVSRFMAATALLAATGCAGVPVATGRAQVLQLVQARTGSVTAQSLVGSSTENIDAQRQLDEWLRQPLQPETAVRIALLRNAAVQGEFAALGISAADVFDAGRPGNPAIGFTALFPTGGASGTKLSVDATLGLGDLLLQHSRTGIADHEYLREQELVAAALLDLAANVQAAWFDCVAATAQAALQQRMAQAAQSSAELAQRYVDAGNLDQLTLQMQIAAASEARIAAQRAIAELSVARSRLQNLMGLNDSDAAWTVPDVLPEPLDAGSDVAALKAMALQQRLDLAAARHHTLALAQQLKSKRRYRLFAASDIGAAGEREADGSRRFGPQLSLALPVFNQGQGTVVRAASELDAARAAQRQIESQIGNEVQLHADQMQQAQQQIRSYRDELLPARTAVVARLQERVNFMLSDTFNLLQARQQQYAASAGLIDVTRDYWRARVELARAAGGRLPEEAQP